MQYLHPRIRFWLELSEALLEAAEQAAPHLRKVFRDHRHRPYRRRRCGPETPLWNMLAALLRAELRTYGAKARLARYLEVPRQRLTDFLTGRSKRLPDAELALRLLHWLAAKRAGRDRSLTEPSAW